MVYVFGFSLKSSINFRGTAAFALAGLWLALLGRGVPAAAQDAATRLPRGPAAILAAYLARHPLSAVTIRFDHPGWSPVKIVRGGGWRPPATAPPSAAASSVEAVAFTDPAERPVTVVRGPAFAAAPILEKPLARGLDPRDGASFDLFAPALMIGLGRIAFAVDGVESNHGATPGMWRPDPAGPQGPMQVSLAAALDVGGGDRFDIARNRALGRAYLAHLYRYYGNWADAVMAYDWGPARVDRWIAGGRPADRLPLVVERYRDRVLGAAALAPERAGIGP